MRTLLFIIILVASAGPALAAKAIVRRSETPESFVRLVYARYRANVSVAVSTERPEGEAFYAGALLDAFAKESAAVHGEVGVIDEDPLCNCQDNGDLTVTGLKVVKGEPNSVKVRVAIFDLGRHDAVTLTLSKAPAGWRIADVAYDHVKSLMALLQSGIAHPGQ